MKWKPISLAPKNDTPVALWTEDREILIWYKRVVYSRGNVFYDPMVTGVTTVRNATHFMLMANMVPAGQGLVADAWEAVFVPKKSRRKLPC